MALMAEPLAVTADCDESDCLSQLLRLWREVPLGFF